MIEDLSNKLTYNSYLKVEELLNLQKEESNPAQHDEMLFIIIHQAYELWFKMILHELKFIKSHIKKDELFHVLHSLKRVTVIQDVLIHQVSILETMSPIDFARFRDHLNPASGFQSHQFRLVEYICGLKNADYLKYHSHTKDVYELLENALNDSSIYDEFILMLTRKGFLINQEVIERKKTVTYPSDESILKAIEKIYIESKDYSDLHHLCELMMDVDSKFSLWRSRHVIMVERMIGNKMGTGGSLGAAYLRSTLPKRFFPELWDVRNTIGSY